MDACARRGSGPATLPSCLARAVVLCGAGGCRLLLLLRHRWVAPGLFLLGLSWACYQSQSAIDDRLPASMDGRTFWIEGRVVGLPSRIGNVVRFELDDIQSRHAGLPSKVRLSWYDGPLLQAGERWRLAARLKRPHGMVNPHAFDYEAWLLATHRRHGHDKGRRAPDGVDGKRRMARSASGAAHGRAGIRSAGRHRGTGGG